MKIEPFILERYFAKYEFSAPYLLSCSDCEPLSLSELLAFADRKTLELWENMRLGYTESLGHPALREEAAGLYLKIKPEELLVIAPEEGIFIAMNVILEKGDHVICTYPGYQSLYEVANALGCEVTKWMPDEQYGWKFDLDILRSAFRPNTKLLVINFPHNPTGSLMDRGGYTEILRLAGERGIIVFSDEMYRFLEYEPSQRLDSACDLYQKAVSLGGLSKSFALAGLRIGWLATEDKELYSKMANFKDYTTICSSAPSEILAIMSLRAKEAILKRNLRIIQDNLRLLDEFFERYNRRFAWVKPKAGTIAFPKMLVPGNTSGFCKDLVEKQGVMLLPSQVYGYDDRHFRIGFGRENIPDCLEKLDDYLSIHQPLS
jgi:aspartate/methionine/tyrosine aminotransferase